MPIWELQPIDLENHNWGASSFKGRIVIRAPSEERARQIATLSFHVSTPYLSVQDTAICPWEYPDLTNCHCAVRENYPEDGPDELLVPTKFDAE